MGSGRGSALTWISRHRLLVGLSVGLVVLAVILGVAIGVPVSRRRERQATGAASTLEERARAILRRYPLIDGHNDLAWQMFINSKNQLSSISLSSDLRIQWLDSAFPPSTDIPRLKQGMVGAQFWACFTSCTTQFKDAVRANLEQVDVIKRIIRKYPETFSLVTTSQGILEAFNNGKIASLIGLEGGHGIDSSLGALRMFYDLGVRYMTLTHNCNTPWADNHKAVNDANENKNGGLSAFGETLILEMNRLGMLIDLSHVSHDTMRDTLRVTRAPVIYSHSSAYGLCNNSRNVPDDILLTTATNGGVVMVNFFPLYISCNFTYATLSQTADHIDYIKEIAGVDHVALGADYDGVPYFPVGLEDVSTYPALFVELLSRGWSEYDLEKLAGRNLVRAFKAAEEIRDRMADEGIGPYENLIDPNLVEDNPCRTPFEVAITF